METIPGFMYLKNILLKAFKTHTIAQTYWAPAFGIHELIDFQTLMHSKFSLAFDLGLAKQYLTETRTHIN